MCKNSILLLTAFCLFILISSHTAFAAVRWYFSGPDIRGQNEDIVLETAASHRRAVSDVYAGREFVFEGQFMWEEGEKLNAGVYFSYYHTLSNYYLGFENDRLYVQRNWEGDRNRVLAHASLNFEKRKWYSFKVMRTGDVYRIFIDGVEYASF
jgi:hypothetical protein